jgi:hypothetical protein
MPMYHFIIDLFFSVKGQLSPINAYHFDEMKIGLMLSCQVGMIEIQSQ